MKIQTILFTACALSLAGAGLALSWAQEPLNSPNNGTVTTTTVTNAAGTISQTNYGSNGEVAGFLVSTNNTNVLLNFPTEVMGGIGTLGVAGNSVTYSGTSVTSSSGFQTVEVSSFTNNSTKATYTSKAPTTAAYGPTSGTVSQLNYDDNGNIDAFVFTPSGGTTSVLVITGSAASATLKPVLTVGATLSVTGTTSTNQASVCAATGSLEVVEASTLKTNSETIVITGGFSGGPPRFGGPPVIGRR
jgi:hypothetical protein